MLHFHGGLVSEKRGRAVAADLLPVYRDAGAYPVFFVWRSGLLEVLRGKLREIASEDAFKALTKLVLKFVIGNVLGAEAAKGGIRVPEEHAVAKELARRQRDEEPYAEFAVPTDVADLTPADERLIEQRMRSDPQLRAVGRAIAESALPAADREGAKGATTGRAAETTLMSPHIVDEVQQGAARPGEGDSSRPPFWRSTPSASSAMSSAAFARVATTASTPP